MNLKVNSVDPDQMNVPADLDLHCLPMEWKLYPWSNWFNCFTHVL
jgi:hypothetical protein